MVRYRFICLAAALMRGDENLARLILALPDSYFDPFDDILRGAWLAGAADEVARR